MFQGRGNVRRSEDGGKTLGRRDSRRQGVHGRRRHRRREFGRHPRLRGSRTTRRTSPGTSWPSKSSRSAKPSAPSRPRRTRRSSPGSKPLTMAACDRHPHLNLKVRFAMYIIQRLLYGIVRGVYRIGGRSDVNNFDHFVISGESEGVKKVIEALSLLRMSDVAAYRHCTRYLTHLVVVDRQMKRGFYTDWLLIQPKVIELPVELIAGYIYRISILARFTKNHVYFVGDYWHRARLCANTLELALLNRMGIGADFRRQQADIIRHFLNEGASRYGSRFRGHDAYRNRLERLESGSDGVYG